MGLLDNKVVIITGAGGGIGRATAYLMAEEGAKVIVNDANVTRDGGPADGDSAEEVASDIRKKGGLAAASRESVCTPAGATAIVALAISEFGGLDCLVNNAAILRDRTLLKMSEDEFDSVIEVNLKGTFLCMQAAAKVMSRSGGGSIVNTTSIAGLRGNFGQANYSAAKAGIFGLTRTGSVELQRYGIRVNAVAPLAKTRMTEELPMFEHVDTMTPAHVAPVHAFLASSLSADLTGSVLSVAGGRLSTYRLVESPGQFKESANGIWTPSEIATQFASIKKS